MAYVFLKNQLPTTSALHFFQLKTLLVTAGWTVQRSGDGLSAYSASADILTTGASGAGGLGNAGAWFTIRQPAAVTGAQRQLQFINGSVSGTDFWTVRYSYSAGFVTGTSNATTAPTATDEVYIVGAAGAPSGAAFGGFASYGTSTRSQYIANNAAPYDFISLSHTTGASPLKQVFMMDGMVSGSYNVLDVDPYVFYFDAGAAYCFQDPFRNPASPNIFANWKKGIAGATFSVTPALVYSDNTTQVVPGLMGVDPYSSKDSVWPLLYGRSVAVGAPSGLKGQSTILKWASNARNTGDTLTVVSTKDYYCAMGTSPFCVALPWDGTTPSV